MIRLTIAALLRLDITESTPRETMTEKEGEIGLGFWRAEGRLGYFAFVEKRGKAPRSPFVLRHCPIGLMDAKLARPRQISFPTRTDWLKQQMVAQISIFRSPFQFPAHCPTTLSPGPLPPPPPHPFYNPSKSSPFSVRSVTFPAIPFCPFPLITTSASSRRSLKLESWSLQACDDSPLTSSVFRLMIS